MRTLHSHCILLLLVLDHHPLPSLKDLPQLRHGRKVGLERLLVHVDGREGELCLSTGQVRRLAQEPWPHHVIAGRPVTAGVGTVGRGDDGGDDGDADPAEVVVVDRAAATPTA